MFPPGVIKHFLSNLKGSLLIYKFDILKDHR